MTLPDLDAPEGAYCVTCGSAQVLADFCGACYEAQDAHSLTAAALLQRVAEVRAVHEAADRSESLLLEAWRQRAEWREARVVVELSLGQLAAMFLTFLAAVAVTGALGYFWITTGAR